MTAITSKSNPTIKFIRKLRGRKAREQSGCYTVAGIHRVMAALDTPASVETVVICPALLNPVRTAEIITRASAHRHIRILDVTPDVFASIGHKQNVHGLIAVMRQTWQRLDQIDLSTQPLWIALDGVQYPGNLGTILRTGDAVGAAGVILLDHTTDPYDPACTNASLSGIFAQRLVRSDCDTFFTWARSQGCTIVGASGDGACCYRAVSYPKPLVLMMGAEGAGLSETHKAACDVLVHIPMLGSNDSLNLAVATGVILYEMQGQWEQA